MIGRQVNFNMTPADQVDMESRVRDVGPMAAVRCHHTGPVPEVLSSITSADPNYEGRKVCIVRPEDVGLLVFDAVEGQNYFVANETRSPMIELTRCGLYDDGLRRGRLYFVPEFDDRGVVVRKSADFVAWARAVLRAATRGLEKDRYGNYLGPEARRLHSAGVLKFSVV